MSNEGILVLTHSTRNTDLRLCSSTYFAKRYGDKERLNNLPKFNELAPVKNVWGSTVSFYKTIEKDNSVKIECLGNIGSDKKIQHATFISDRELFVCYEYHAELWKLENDIKMYSKLRKGDFNTIKKYEHNHFPGLHTGFVIENSSILVSSSASDAVLIINKTTGVIEKMHRMPEDIYGFNYKLTEDMDLRKHYINNDCQTTHINCAYPRKNKNKAVVSLLIQGAVGEIDLKDGSYRELARGYHGCHGARVNDNDEIYFCDSAVGALVFLNNDGSIEKRFNIDSQWLHDVQHLHEDVYAFGLADKNELRIYDIEKEELLYKKKFLKLNVKKQKESFYMKMGWKGSSTQFLSFYKYKS